MKASAFRRPVGQGSHSGSKIERAASNKPSGSRLFVLSAAADLCLIAVLWIAAVTLSDPSGDFPINDDFFYRINVERLLDEGAYRPTGFESATLLTHILWGGLFAALLGLSYEVLRYSVIAVSLIGLMTVYLIARQLNCSRLISILSALILAFNPVYFSLSFSFMSDITFNTFMLLSILFLVRYLMAESPLDLLLGSGMVLVSMLCRQTGMAIPIAFFIAVFLVHGRRNIVVAMFPLVVGALAYLTFSWWLLGVTDNREFYGHMEKNFLYTMMSPSMFFSNVASNLFAYLMYLGLFVLPLTCAFPVIVGKFLKPFLIVLIISVFSFSFISLVNDGLMPVKGNYLGRAALGPMFFPALVEAGGLPDYPKWFWIYVTSISILGAGFLLAIVALRLLVNHNDYSSKVDRVEIFFLLSAMIYLIPVIATWFFDRYLISPMVLLLLFVASKIKKQSLSVTSLFIIVFFMLTYSAFSMAATHDFMALNRERWRVLNGLLAEGVPPSSIDGGYEFNGEYLLADYDRYKEKIWGTREFVDDDYIIAFGPIPGYRVIGHRAFERWIPFAASDVLLLKRD